MDEKQALNKAAQEKDPLERHVKIAAIITTALQAKNTRVVMVGGSALEVYTSANRQTVDIDLVAFNDEHIKEVMYSLGFNNDDKSQPNVFKLTEHPHIIIDFRSRPLAVNNDRVKEVFSDESETSLVYIPCVEDMIIDRACHALSRKKDNSEWINYMINSYKDEIDWDYLNKQAEWENCTHIINDAKQWVNQQHFIKATLSLEFDHNSSLQQLSLKTMYSYFAQQHLKENLHLPCDIKMDTYIFEKMLEQNININDIQSTIENTTPCLSPKDNKQEYIKRTTSLALENYNFNHDDEILLNPQNLSPELKSKSSDMDFAKSLFKHKYSLKEVTQSVALNSLNIPTHSDKAREYIESIIKTAQKELTKETSKRKGCTR